MKANIGTADRVVRVIAGFTILGVGIYFRNRWGLIGLLPLLTAGIRFCPLYVPFGISTCRTDAEKPDDLPPGARSA
jgi:hypothetical protein